MRNFTFTLTWCGFRFCFFRNLSLGWLSFCFSVVAIHLHFVIYYDVFEWFLDVVLLKIKQFWNKFVCYPKYLSKLLCMTCTIYQLPQQLSYSDSTITQQDILDSVHSFICGWIQLLCHIHWHQGYLGNIFTTENKYSFGHSIVAMFMAHKGNMFIPHRGSG